MQEVEMNESTDSVTERVDRALTILEGQSVSDCGRNFTRLRNFSLGPLKIILRACATFCTYHSQFIEAKIIRSGI